MNVFRAPDALPAIADEAVEDRRRKPLVSVRRDQRRRRAHRGSGRRVGVMDRCIKVEHARYVGRMHWLGFNTQRITSVRGGLQ